MVWNTPRGAFKKFSTGRNFVFKTPCAFFHLIFFALFPVTATHVAFAPLVCNPKTHRHTTPKPNWEIVKITRWTVQGGGGERRDTKQKKSKRIKSKEFKTNLLPPNTMTINLVMEFSLSFRRQKSKSSCYILTLQLDFLLPLCFKFFFFPL